jgi:hypothetical protein
VKLQETTVRADFFAWRDLEIANKGLFVAPVPIIFEDRHNPIGVEFADRGGRTKPVLDEESADEHALRSPPVTKRNVQGITHALLLVGARPLRS